MNKPKLLEPFIRNLNQDQEPDDHQKMFLYLPLSVLRDFTNIESIITDDFIQRKAKQPTKREIEKALDNHHQQMHKLHKWKHWSLDKLAFRLPHSNHIR